MSRRLRRKRKPTHTNLWEQDYDELELDYNCGIQYIPRLHDTDPDIPPMRRIHHEYDSIQRMVRHAVHIASFHFPEWED